jgi:tetratricopeptide (TPR) repeat protein
MAKTFATRTEIDSLRIAAGWPNASPQVQLVLMNQLLAARRYDEAHEFFAKLGQEHPDQALPLAIAGVALSKMDGRLDEAMDTLDAAVATQIGLPNYLRGIVRAEAGVTAGIADLELVVALPDRFPAGLRRSAYHGLATLYAAAGRDEDTARPGQGRHRPARIPAGGRLLGHRGRRIPFRPATSRGGRRGRARRPGL